MASSMQKSSEARDDVEEGLEDGEEEGPIPLDDGPVEDEVLDDMDGDDAAFYIHYFLRCAHQGPDWSCICKCYNSRCPYQGQQAHNLLKYKGIRIK